MKLLFFLALMIVRSEIRPLLIGLGLSISVLLMGGALLALSGWFITAAATAGLAGIGILFNVFAPSAMVRFLALGRTATRYGERLTTHDAVLRALSDLRIRVLQGLLAQPFRALEKLRADAALNRVTSDIDALDGVLLRLVLPGLAGLATLSVATAALWWLVHPAVGLIVGAGFILGSAVIFVVGQRMARRPSRQAEAAMQASRRRLIELVTARDDLTVYRQMQAAQNHCRAGLDRNGDARRHLDKIERRTGFGLDILSGAIVAAVVGIGGVLTQSGTVSAATAAIGVFSALALTEAIAPVRRALTEVGRMVQAARRIQPVISQPQVMKPASKTLGQKLEILRLDNLSFQQSGIASPLFSPVDFCVYPGETVALTGASGSGKSTVLLMVAGALPPSGGRVILHDAQGQIRTHSALDDRIVMVPQRHGLIAGSVARNLRLACPDSSDEMMWKALRTVQLSDTVAAKGGLDFKLGFRGAGLSGGEARRLVLARALLRDPQILLLDEPTEGLDHAMAKQVMAGIRSALPDAMILIAAHRDAETESADKVVSIGPAVAENPK